MSVAKDRPIVIIALVLLVLAALAFAWRQYRAMTTVPKESTVQLTPDQLKEAMQKDR